MVVKCACWTQQRQACTQTQNTPVPFYFRIAVQTCNRACIFSYVGIERSFELGYAMETTMHSFFFLSVGDIVFPAAIALEGVIGE